MLITDKSSIKVGDIIFLWYMSQSYKVTKVLDRDGSDDYYFEVDELDPLGEKESLTFSLDITIASDMPVWTTPGRSLDGIETIFEISKTAQSKVARSSGSSCKVFIFDDDEVYPMWLWKK